MGSYLNPGNLSFRGSLRSKIYVDKSELIARTNEALCTEQKYICVSRPRRFGKSMAANMLAAYYDRSEDTAELFQNLAISKDRSYKENLNQYDVIKINMQEFLSMSKTMEEKKVIEQSSLNGIPQNQLFAYVDQNRQPGESIKDCFDRLKAAEQNQEGKTA